MKEAEKTLAATAYMLGRSHTCPKCEHSNIPCHVDLRLSDRERLAACQS